MAGRSKAASRDGGPPKPGNKILGVPLPEEAFLRMKRLAASHLLTSAAVGRHLIMGALLEAETNGLKLYTVEPVGKIA
jgi:hypothetical protein